MPDGIKNGIIAFVLQHQFKSPVGYNLVDVHIQRFARRVLKPIDDDIPPMLSCDYFFRRLDDETADPRRQRPRFQMRKSRGFLRMPAPS